MGACMSTDIDEAAMQAVRVGSLSELQRLALVRGASRLHVNKKFPDEGGQTLIMEAAARGHNKLVAFLIDNQHANVDLQNNAGYTALTLALSQRPTNDGAATLLVHAGANLDYSDNVNGKSALLWAVSAASASTIKMLCAKGADLEAKARDGRTALIIAADENNADVVRVLLHAGASVKTQDLKAGTALSHAREKKHTLVVQLLEAALAAGPGAAAGGAGAGASGARAAAGTGGGGGGGGAGGIPKKADPMARLLNKGALGSQVADTFATGGRAKTLENNTREAMKDIKFATTSNLEAVQSMGKKK